MSALAAHLRHSTPGRTRVEIPGLKGSCEKLSSIANEMTNLLDGVEMVKMNPSLGTLTVFHTPRLRRILLDESRRRHWFDVREAEVEGKGQARELTELIRESAQNMDRQIKFISGNRMSIKTLTFLSLAGLGVLQMRRGKALPAGLTLLMQATTFVNGNDGES